MRLVELSTGFWVPIDKIKRIEPRGQHYFAVVTEDLTVENVTAIQIKSLVYSVNESVRI